MEKSHWRLQPLNWPNQPSGKTWADHYIQAANRTLWPASAPEANRHHGLCTLRLQRSRTDGPPHPPGLSHLAETENTSYGRSVSQPLTSCGERRKTCAAPPSSWQHVDWGSKRGWSTAEEEEEETFTVTTTTNLITTTTVYTWHPIPHHATHTM